MKTYKRTLTVDLWIEDGNAMAEFTEGETGCSIGVVVPYSPDEHPEFDKLVGDELYSWLMIQDENCDYMLEDDE